VFFVVSLALAPFVGQDFFPSVDAGQLRLHVRCPAGTRLEETERVFHGVDNEIRALIPRDELKLIIDNVGLPVSGINLAQSDTVTIGNADGEILVSLTPEHHPIQKTIEQLRTRLKKKYPNVEFFFQPADIVNQILNFGLPAPIDIQVVGKSEENYALAKKISHEVEKIPGTVDVHVHQVLTTPSILLNVDRDRAAGLGLTQSDVASNLLISLSSSGQGSPSFWLDPKSGVSYSVASQTPQYNNDSVEALLNTPVASSGKTQTLLGNVSTVGRGQSAQVVSHYNVQNVFDVYANVQGRDLGTVSRAVDKVIAANSKKLPRGTSINIRGQVESMNASFTGLGAGLLFAILLVYLLIVVNFQSWIDPLIIIGALPGALSGIVWMLFVTQTTFSVPSLMGAIMCMGVSTANSILVITFANDRRAEGDTAYQAALAAGFTRLRPVMMTALAMVIGMLPMSLGLGEGGEQNAPLGRAVIGGLGVATIATLFFVPVLYSVLRRKAPASPELDSLGS
jgi:multidrug efflux pump subunit AcrB